MNVIFFDPSLIKVEYIPFLLKSLRITKVYNYDSDSYIGELIKQFSTSVFSRNKNMKDEEFLKKIVYDIINPITDKHAYDGDILSISINDLYQNSSYLNINYSESTSTDPNYLIICPKYYGLNFYDEVPQYIINILNKYSNGINILQERIGFLYINSTLSYAERYYYKLKKWKKSQGRTQSGIFVIPILRYLLRQCYVENPDIKLYMDMRQWLLKHEDFQNYLIQENIKAAEEINEEEDKRYEAYQNSLAEWYYEQNERDAEAYWRGE